MLSFFDNNKPFLVIPLLVLSLLLHLRLLFDGVDLADTQVQAPMALSLVSVLNLKSGISPWVIYLISSVTLFLGAMVFNQFFNESKFLERSSHLPAYFYILIGSYYTEFLQLQPMLFANVLFLLSLNQLFSAYSPGSAFKPIFNCGALMALAALFYFPFLFVMPVLLIILLLIRGFVWREWLVMLLGIVTPFYILLAYYYLSNQIVIKLGFKLTPKAKTIAEMLNQMNWLDFGQSFFLLALTIFGLFMIQSNYLSSQIKIRKFFNSFYWILAFCFIAALAEFPPDLKQFMILTVPLSFALTYPMMQLENSRWAKLINFALLFIIVFGQYFSVVFK